MALLGVIKGFSNLPVDMQDGVKAVGDSLFINTNYSFNKAVQRTFDIAVENIIRNGGEVSDEVIYISMQKTEAPALEVSFPGVVYDHSVSVFAEDNFNLTGNWHVYKEVSWDGKQEKDQAIFSANAGDELEFSFEGTGISLFGNWVKNGGKADIYLDGIFQRTIDTYYYYANQEHRFISLWHVFGLIPGKHTLKVVVKGEKNTQSSGTNIFISQAVIYKTGEKKCDTYKYSFEK
jgi:hypothetical protein